MVDTQHELLAEYVDRIIDHHEGEVVCVWCVCVWYVSC